MQQPDEEEFKLVKEELIGHYQKELAFIYTHHCIPPVEYFAPVKGVITRLIPLLDGRNLNIVLCECWAKAWQREPLCHPNDKRDSALRPGA